MKWVICQYCKAEYAVTDDESIKDWGKCEVCGHNDWKEEPQLMNEDNDDREIGRRALVEKTRILNKTFIKLLEMLKWPT